MSLKIKAAKLSDVILEQLENMILEGSLAAGQKLPPERELAKQFEVSRPSLREAIQKLEAKGLVTRRQGGGTYVKNQLEGGMTDPLFELISKHPESQFDLLEFRHALEGIAAYYAALRGTATDYEKITRHFDLIAAAESDLTAKAKAINGFHFSIAEASHNVVLLHLVRGMEALLEQNIVQNLTVLLEKPVVRNQLAQHRKGLLDAVINGEPDKARLASNAHLAFIEEALLEAGREHSRIERSLRRTQQN
ncbi:pyruvate dehydrogenase complex transcriptional repressor PdhR [Pseudoalteromonas tunicata]|jgi:GntR family transcriptional repressor for pyruvate dehydrogenase complex|uniref:Pyruvate dehydrogenase complex repressor n=1 Tax=Pseudoalteromonas tunicata D2 TaxID=87626 RepID=A4C8Z6_9GAMM|nr:pyruvate dehydrogenase complex transcriptional repressor PdhR [Pseudoalteromonas tunicata]ATC93563.1 GntR family transcriptional regulator, transcriptional repressor for pyruvate dehydrogenase complex [Pseudoalteromonas tunicata]AXT29404.1 pyruvate dehydrogenase complex transcriptional repressor PdhR [Pseudoalteromonas tunicata]EAR29061.1 transcriptional regulator of pyruvate dehydrogenase complex [Pseudoalteromonas tunicata D2]MDP4983228.1 pyruvate dehydrogenase complex transcriptional repr